MQFELLMLKNIVLLIIIVSNQSECLCQSASENIHLTDTSARILQKPLLNFSYKQLIIPSVGILYGIIGLKNPSLRLINREIREEVNEHIDQKFSLDDVTQYLPAASVFGLGFLGVKGKNSLKEKSIVVLTSYLFMISMVSTLKNTTKIERPDKTGHNSFPSGHTATAFVGAELVWQEYRDQSLWYGIAGYTIASGTGVFRILNNRHWLTDVTMGAGIGILSAKLAYWIYPYLNRTFFTNSKKIHKYETNLNLNQHGLCLQIGF